MRAAFNPLGGPGFSPTRMAWAPLASCAPFGFSLSSVSEVTGGKAPAAVSRDRGRGGAGGRVAPVSEQDGAPGRRRHERPRRYGSLPVLLVDEHDRGRSRLE